MKHAIRLLALTILLTAGLQAQTLNGRFVTSAYGWERQLQSGESSSQLRAYENVQLNFGTPDISFHTYFQGSTDFSNEAENDPRFRLFNAYLRVKNLADMIDLKIGRQAMFAGVSYGTIDGASIKARPTDGVEVLAYAGGLTRPSQDIEYHFYDHVQDNWQLGGQVLLYLVRNTKIGLSYMNRHRETELFYAWHPDAQMELQPALIDYGSRANQYGSVNVAHSTGKLWLYGRYDYDFNFERTSRAEVAASYQATSDLGLSLNLAHREPIIAYNSYFALLEAEANQEAVLGIDYRVHPRLTLMGRFSTVMYDDENAFRVSAGAMNKYASIMYTKDVSYDGDLDGFNLHFTYPLMQGMLVPHVGAVYSTYALGDDLDKTSTWVGVVGTTVRPVKTLSIDIQGQYMTNKIYESDMRAFARINYWFSNPFGIGK
ncbi:MAG: hypothetical protein C0600_12710 [Ignavibacteria bacterium]|nr:MAG: hypothetical protein C0600_12710 [Ignavibacteria bacterium]